MSARKYSYWRWAGNNSLMSNLMSGALVAAVGVVIYLVVGKLSDNPLVPAIAAILSAVCAMVFGWLIFWWYHRSEGFLAKECGFSRPNSLWGERNKCFIDGFEKDALKPRAGLHEWLKGWCEAGIEETGVATAKICVVRGKRNAGRTSIVMHACLCDDAAKPNKNRVFYMLSGASRDLKGNSSGESVDRNECIVDWVMATSKKKKYIVLMSSQDIDLHALVEAKAKASSLRRNICFVVKAPNLAGNRNETLQNIDEVFSIGELTPEECQSFIYKYASNTWRLNDLAVLKEQYKGQERKEDYGRWFRICSGGCPERLIRLFDCHGRTRHEIIGEFLFALKFKVDQIKGQEFAFLWCLFVERERASRYGGNCNIHIGRILQRLNCLDGSSPKKLAEVVFRKELAASCSLLALDDLIKNSHIHIPIGVFIASLGYQKVVSSFGLEDDDDSFQGMIAEWLKSLIRDDASGDETAESVSIIVDSMIDALLCVGFLGAASAAEDIEEYMFAIDGLERQVGISGEADFDNKVREFFSDLRESFVRRVFETCIDNIGFADDEKIVGIVSSALCACKDAGLFLTFYAYALPMLGILVCDPLRNKAVGRFRELFWQHYEGSEDQSASDKLDRLWLETFFLCAIRNGYADAECVNEVLYGEKGFATVVNCWAENGGHISPLLLRLAEDLNNRDVPSFVKNMRGVFRLIQDHEWDGLKIMIALSLSYTTTSDVVVDGKTWDFVIRGINGCRFDVDPGSKIVKAVSFSVMMRRAFYKYCENNVYDPWIIDVDKISEDGEENELNVRMGAKKAQWRKVTGLSANDLLSYLPVIVRQFAECTCMKMRGLAQYEKTLEEDWRKINQIVTAENWYGSINRRSRYWILFWSSLIVRDVMDEGEQRKFRERFCEMCGEVSETDNLWYRHLALRTVANVIRDKPLLNKVADVVYKLILDDYPAMVSANKCDRDAWLDCALCLFEDYLCDVSTTREPRDMFMVIIRTICGVDVKTDIDALNTYSMLSPELRGFFVGVLEKMLVDVWNKSVAGKTESISMSVAFIRACIDNGFPLKLRDDVEAWQDSADQCEYALRSCLCAIGGIIANHASFGGMVDADLMGHIEFCMDSYEALGWSVDTFAVNSIDYVAQVCGEMPESAAFVERCLSFGAKWRGQYMDQWCSVFDQKCENAVEEQRFLRAVWACPAKVFNAIGDDLVRKICEHLENTLDVYSSKWQEGFRSDWYKVVAQMTRAKLLQRSPVGFLTKIERLFFAGGFEKLCPDVKAHRSFLIDVCQALLEGHCKNKSAITADVAKQYQDVWQKIRSDLKLDDIGAEIKGECALKADAIRYIDATISGLMEGGASAAV